VLQRGSTYNKSDIEDYLNENSDDNNTQINEYTIEEEADINETNPNDASGDAFKRMQNNY
jgi:hypothetical protein